MTRSFERPTVVVDPPAQWERRRRLFSVIEEALRLRIVPCTRESAAVASAAVAFGERSEDRSLPTIVLPSDAPPTSGKLVDIMFSPHARIDRSVRGRSLAHRAFPVPALPSAEDHEVIAQTDGAPVWVRHGDAEYVAVGMSELAEGEILRSRLCAQFFLPLLPVVDFLRRRAPSPFTSPRPGAAFLFDDPNLHRVAYGYLDYRSVARDAREVGYHVAFATIPLDTWYASRSAVELFRSQRDVLSLLMHGNNHVRRELAQPLPQAERRALLGQALQRIESFERRYDLPVARVMAPPHGACSEAMARDMALLGYDALCVSRPYPWRESPPPDRALAGWFPSEIGESGLPIVPRVHLGDDRAELALRAFLRQPIILYGHHGDVRAGLDTLRNAAAEVNAAIDAHWTSLDEIVSALYEWRVEAERLYLHLHSRRAILTIPEGISELVVEWPDRAAGDRIAVDGETADEFPMPIAGRRKVVVRVMSEKGPDLSSASAVRPHLWPFVRRGLTEARDRLVPLAAHVRAGPKPRRATGR